MIEPTSEEQVLAFLAWKRGETIEGKREHGEWWTILPNYHLSAHTTIRLKSKPKLRPWRVDEVPVGALIRHREWPELGDGPSLILGACRHGLHYLDDCNSRLVSKIAFTEALRLGMEHSTDGGKTWLPCGVVSE